MTMGRRIDVRGVAQLVCGHNLDFRLRFDSQYRAFTDAVPTDPELAAVVDLAIGRPAPSCRCSVRVEPHSP